MQPTSKSDSSGGDGWDEWDSDDERAEAWGWDVEKHPPKTPSTSLLNGAGHMTSQPPVRKWPTVKIALAVLFVLGGCILVSSVMPLLPIKRDVVSAPVLRVGSLDAPSLDKNTEQQVRPIPEKDPIDIHAPALDLRSSQGVHELHAPFTAGVGKAPVLTGSSISTRERTSGPLAAGAAVVGGARDFLPGTPSVPVIPGALSSGGDADFSSRGSTPSSKHSAPVTAPVTDASSAVGTAPHALRNSGPFQASPATNAGPLAAKGTAPATGAGVSSVSSPATTAAPTGVADGSAPVIVAADAAKQHPPAHPVAGAQQGAARAAVDSRAPGVKGPSASTVSAPGSKDAAAGATTAGVSASAATASKAAPQAIPEATSTGTAGVTTVKATDATDEAAVATRSAPSVDDESADAEDAVVGTAARGGVTAAVSAAADASPAPASTRQAAVTASATSVIVSASGSKAAEAQAAASTVKPAAAVAEAETDAFASDVAKGSDASGGAEADAEPSAVNAVVGAKASTAVVPSEEDEVEVAEVDAAPATVASTVAASAGAGAGVKTGAVAAVSVEEEEEEEGDVVNPAPHPEYAPLPHAGVAGGKEELDNPHQAPHPDISGVPTAAAVEGKVASAAAKAAAVSAATQASPAVVAAGQAGQLGDVEEPEEAAEEEAEDVESDGAAAVSSADLGAGARSIPYGLRVKSATGTPSASVARASAVSAAVKPRGSGVLAASSQQAVTAAQAEQGGDDGSDFPAGGFAVAGADDEEEGADTETAEVTAAGAAAGAGTSATAAKAAVKADEEVSSSNGGAEDVAAARRARQLHAPRRSLLAQASADQTKLAKQLTEDAAREVHEASVIAAQAAEDAEEAVEKAVDDVVVAEAAEVEAELSVEALEAAKADPDLILQAKRVAADKADEANEKETSMKEAKHAAAEAEEDAQTIADMSLKAKKMAEEANFETEAEAEAATIEEIQQMALDAKEMGSEAAQAAEKASIAATPEEARGTLIHTPEEAASVEADGVAIIAETNAGDAVDEANLASALAGQAQKSRDMASITSASAVAQAMRVNLTAQELMRAAETAEGVKDVLDAVDVPTHVKAKAAKKAQRLKRVSESAKVMSLEAAAAAGMAEKTALAAQEAADDAVQAAQEASQEANMAVAEAQDAQDIAQAVEVAQSTNELDVLTKDVREKAKHVIASGRSARNAAALANADANEAAEAQEEAAEAEEVVSADRQQVESLLEGEIQDEADESATILDQVAEAAQVALKAVKRVREVAKRAVAAAQVAESDAENANTAAAAAENAANTADEENRKTIEAAAEVEDEALAIQAQSTDPKAVKAATELGNVAEEATVQAAALAKEAMKAALEAADEAEMARTKSKMIREYSHDASEKELAISKVSDAVTATDAAAELLVQTVMELAEQAERIETEAAEAGRLAAELAGEVADEAATAMEDKEEAEDMARASVVDPALEAAADRHHKSVRQQGQLEADAMEHAENGLRWFEGKRCNDFICMTVNRGLPSAVGPKRGPVSATAKSASFPLIYMAVLPGAGSLYVRELLEATTGLVVETAFKEAGSQPEQRDMDLKATFARSCGIVGSCERVHRSKDKEALILASYEPLDAKIDASDFRRSAAYLIVLIRNPVDAYATQVRAGGSAGRDFVHYLTHQWIEFVKYWEASRLPKTTVRYEDLAVNPEGAIVALMDDSGLSKALNKDHIDVTKSVMAQHAKSTNKQEASAVNQLAKLTSNPHTTARVLGVLKAHGQTLAKYGYIFDYANKPAEAVETARRILELDALNAAQQEAAAARTE